MKKIGLAVCYNTKNFGSQLQVLATILKIEELGFRTEIIQYKKAITPQFIKQSIARVLNPEFLVSRVRNFFTRRKIAKDRSISAKIRKRNQRFAQFAEKHFSNISKPYVGWEQLVSAASKNYDAFLCGSDQLWLPQGLCSHFYTLEFAPKDKPKISYATSFGVSRIPASQKKATARYLNRFQALSTRELTGHQIIKSLTGRDARVVCDPTLLFSAEEWLQIIPDHRVVDEPYIFCYFLGDNVMHRQQAVKLREKTGLILVSTPFLNSYVKEDKTFSDVPLYDLDSADFVNLIRHAEYVLTDSFHGSVFSVIHHKKFVTFDRFRAGANSRNGRIDTLCTLLGISDRRFSGDITDVKMNVDYFRVDSIMEKLRENSVNYLIDVLNEAFPD